MKRLFWLHDESLSVPAAAKRDDLLVFFWHSDYFSQQAWSLKRLVFIYETLCSLPVTIYAGEPTRLLQALKREHTFSDIMVQRPFDPLLTVQLNQVEQTHPLNLYNAPSMMDNSQIKPCKRFYAYWQQIEGQLLLAQREMASLSHLRP